MPTITVIIQCVRCFMRHKHVVSTYGLFWVSSYVKILLHSYFNVFTGLALAAFIVCSEIVAKPITITNNDAPTKT